MISISPRRFHRFVRSLGLSAQFPKALNHQLKRPQVLRYLALGLPIPLVALVFWFGGQLLTQHLLGYAYELDHSLNADTLAKIQVQAAVLALEVEVKSHVDFTLVRVKTTDSALKVLELEFPTTDITEIEAAIAQELSLSPDIVRQLAHYQIE